MPIDLNPTARKITALLGGVDDKQLDAPTPCPEYTVAALLDHLMGLALAFAASGRKVAGPHTDSAPDPKAEDLDPEWRRLLPQRLADMADAWNEDGAWDGDATAGGITMPAAVMGLVALDELVIHGWDLARATGQDFEPEAEAVAGITSLLDQGEADDESDGGGLFGPPVRVPDTASPLERAVGLSGRDPAWTSPGV